eukprot:TRINITY_DN2988_c0_g1_i1.p1 TRINITY_DN2988_c0_g1~~TRINITY_DN2988_c0_g1_i1.p1  ORF type:complete len:303 (-),score=40.89 TRINITY_DN2988_c0_g1_i1:111-1019(-)
MDDDNCGRHYLTCCGVREKAQSDEQIEAETPLIVALAWDEVPAHILLREGAGLEAAAIGEGGSLERTIAKSPNFHGAAETPPVTRRAIFQSDQDRLKIPAMPGLAADSLPWPSSVALDQNVLCPSLEASAKTSLGPRWQPSQPCRPSTSVQPAALESLIEPCSGDLGLPPGEKAKEFVMLTPNSVCTVWAENVRSSTPRKGGLHSMLEEVLMQTPESMHTDVASVACSPGNSPGAQPRYMALASCSPDSGARPRYAAVAFGSPGNSPGSRPRCSAVACSSPCNSPRAQPRSMAVASNVRRRL